MKTDLARIVSIILALFMLSIPFRSFSQASNKTRADYGVILGDDYLFALKVIEKNSWWSDTLLKDGLDPGFALAIIFPELIRYSSISDYIEVKSLEVLYVQYGIDYADFSIGFFQMKPSFAEQIEKDILEFDFAKTFPELSAIKPDFSETIDSRKERIIRLKDEYGQILYLEAFIRIMDKLYPDQEFHSTEDKLTFYSAAYNTGYFKEEQVIRNEITRKRFYRGMDLASAKYSYSDISLFYYISVKAR